MKKLFVLSFVVLFALVGAQAFASPPVKPPVEGFLIETTTDIIVDGSMSERQNFNWIYWEGWGTGPFFPGGYNTAACIGCGIDPAVTGATNTQGFSEGAQIAYQQTFDAIDGVTTFKKDFWASSTANSDGNNLTVDKTIIYDQTPGGSGFAKHTEKLGLSVVAAGTLAGAGGPDGIASILSLCPWGGQGGTLPGTPGYPPTNEGIAAGSEFNVTNIVFTSSSAVSSTVNPYLSYAVTGDGIGTIKAGFVVELFEGPEKYVYSMLPVTGNAVGGVPTTCWLPPSCPPPLASRTSYSEHASADGVWTFNKAVKYTSLMPSGAPGATLNPIGNVP